MQGNGGSRQDGQRQWEGEEENRGHVVGHAIGQEESRGHAIGQEGHAIGQEGHLIGQGSGRERIANAAHASVGTTAGVHHPSRFEGGGEGSLTIGQPTTILTTTPTLTTPGGSRSVHGRIRYPPYPIQQQHHHQQQSTLLPHRGHNRSSSMNTLSTTHTSRTIYRNSVTTAAPPSANVLEGGSTIRRPSSPYHRLKFQQQQQQQPQQLLLQRDSFPAASIYNRRARPTRSSTISSSGSYLVSHSMLKHRNSFTASNNANGDGSSSTTTTTATTTTTTVNNDVLTNDVVELQNMDSSHHYDYRHDHSASAPIQSPVYNQQQPDSFPVQPTVLESRSPSVDGSSVLSSPSLLRSAYSPMHSPLHVANSNNITYIPNSDASHQQEQHLVLMPGHNNNNNNNNINQILFASSSPILNYDPPPHTRLPSNPVDIYASRGIDLFDSSTATPSSFADLASAEYLGNLNESSNASRNLRSFQFPFPDYGGTRSGADNPDLPAYYINTNGSNSFANIGLDDSGNFDGYNHFKQSTTLLDSQAEPDQGLLESYRPRRSQSSIYFNPDSPDSDSDTTPTKANAHGRPFPSVLTSTIDLCNTIMGTGLLSIPYAFATVGIGYGVLLVLCSAAATWFSVRLLISSAQLAYGTGTGRLPHQTSLFIAEGEPSYGALARTAMGRQGAMWADIAMSACCFGFAVSYMASIADSMPRAAAAMFPEYWVGSWVFALLQTPQFWMFAFLAVIAPLCYSKSVDDFWWFSSTALGAALYIAFVVICLSYFAPHGHKDNDKHDNVPWFSVKIEAFETISIYIFAFTCHQNIFSVYNEVGAAYRGESVAPATIRHIRRVVDLSIISVAVLYLAVGICGFLAFGNASLVLVLDNFPDTFPIVFGRLMYALLAALSVPIQVHPCRACIDSVLTTYAYQYRYTRLLAYHTLADPALSPTFSTPYTIPTVMRRVHKLLHHAMQQEQSRRYLITTLILVVVYLTSLCFNALVDVLSFVGGTSGVVMCFVMPALFYWNLTTPETGGWRRPFSVVLAASGSICGLLNVGWLVVGAFYR
ncbi:hypothetical protein BASA61_010371 [Batrachochytrium salamandrivorans]|nr:hypothetical protein BASA61_010371 [Batrachochytrium salamandrivorans]